jgi:hypothetical protein
MTGVIVGLGIGIAASLIASEMTDFTPLIARWLVRWAARRWSTDADDANSYGEEWQRVIEDRPGKVLKVATALGLTSGALARSVSRTARELFYGLLCVVRRLLYGQGLPEVLSCADLPQVLSRADREDVLEDLADMGVYQALLSPVGVRGLVIDCEECHEPHYFDWGLLRDSLRHLLESGLPPMPRSLV